MEPLRHPLHRGADRRDRPLALAGHKRAIRTLRAELARLPEEVVEELIELSLAGVGSADFAKGQRAFAEKRQPTWTGM